MNDLVKQLRTGHHILGPSSWELDAANEIERLRTALEDIAEGIWHPDTPLAEIISDTRKRARAALASTQRQNQGD